MLNGEKMKTKNTYLKGNVTFKDIKVTWQKIDNVIAFDNKELTEKFYFTLSYNNVKISFDFYNSIMERQISDIMEMHGILESFCMPQFKQTVYTELKRRPLNMWGGYDKLRDLKAFQNKRIYYLLYGALHSFFLDSFNFSDYNPTFKDFCFNYGYDEDSIKANKIYKKCIKQVEKLKKLKLSDKLLKYIEENIMQETDKYSKDISEVL